MASKRQLLLELLARDKTKQATDSAADNLDGVTTAADRAAEATEKLGDTSDAADGQVERFGKSAKTAAEHVDDLDRQIENVEKELRQLAVAWKEAESAAEKADLSKAIRRTQRDLRELGKSKGLLSALIPSPADIDVAGKAAARGLMSAIGSGVSSIAASAGSAAGPVVGGAIGLAAAPTLVSALGSALSAGAGLGVIGVGIMAAVKGDPKIQQAGKEAGQKFKAGLQAEAKVLRGPILESIGILSAAGTRLTKDLGEAFDELSDDITPFVRKVVGAGEAVTGSLIGAAKESGPALDGLGDSITLLGAGVSKFIDGVADGGPEAADNLRLIAGALGDMLAHTGMVLGELNELANNPILTGPLLPLLREHYAEVAGESNTLAAGTEDAAAAMTNAEKAARGQADALSLLGKELQAQTDPVFKMLRAQDDLASAQGKVTEAAKKHGRDSPEYEEALRRATERALELESAAGAVAATSSGKLTPELKATLRAAGFTEKQIKDLAKQFGEAKREGDAFAKTYPAKANLDTATAMAKAKALRKYLRDIPDEDVRVAVRITGASNSAAAASIRKQYRAEGGPVTAGVPYIVGEKRPEVFVPESNGKIVPSVGAYMNSRSGGTSPMGGAAGGGWVAIRSDAVIDALVQAIASRVSAKGGRAAQLGIRFSP